MLFPTLIQKILYRVNAYNEFTKYIVGSWVKVGNILSHENIDESPLVYLQSEVLPAFALLNSAQAYLTGRSDHTLLEKSIYIL